MTYLLKSQIRAGGGGNTDHMSPDLRRTCETDAPNSWGSVEPE